VSLQQVIIQKPRISFLRACWCIDTVISCIIWWNLRQWININNFSFMNQPTLTVTVLNTTTEMHTHCHCATHVWQSQS